MKRIVTIFSALIIIVLLVSCQKTNNEQMSSTESKSNMSSTSSISQNTSSVSSMQNNYIDVKPSKAKELIETNKELIVLDVSPKYAQGHLPRAINIYIDELEKRIGELDSSKPILVYCHVDSVSIRGAQILIQKGFNPVYRLEGNYSAWVDAGYTIEK